MFIVIAWTILFLICFFVSIFVVVGGYRIETPEYNEYVVVKSFFTTFSNNSAPDGWETTCIMPGNYLYFYGTRQQDEYFGRIYRFVDDMGRITYIDEFDMKKIRKTKWYDLKRVKQKK